MRCSEGWTSVKLVSLLNTDWLALKQVVVFCCGFFGFFGGFCLFGFFLVVIRYHCHSSM